MAVNTSSREFRNIDIDQYNEDTYSEAHEDEDQYQNGVEEAMIVSLINAGNQGEALRTLLHSAPICVKGKNELAKEAHLDLILKVLLSVNKTQMDSMISKFDTNTLDVLMKYIYRGFEKPSEKSSAILLAWHDRVYKVSGLGSIVRVLTDRRTV